jgi:hypothetical protein
VVDEDVALAHRREHIGVLAVIAEQPRLRDGAVRGIAQLTGKALDAIDVPEVAQV